jgi:hypothetical protein
MILEIHPGGVLHPSKSNQAALRKQGYKPVEIFKRLQKQLHS